MGSPLHAIFDLMDSQSVELFKHVQSGAFYLSQGLEDNVWKVPPADWLIL